MIILAGAHRTLRGMYTEISDSIIAAWIMALVTKAFQTNICNFMLLCVWMQRRICLFYYDRRVFREWHQYSDAILSAGLQYKAPVEWRKLQRIVFISVHSIFFFLANIKQISPPKFKQQAGECFLHLTGKETHVKPGWIYDGDCLLTTSDSHKLTDSSANSRRGTCLPFLLVHAHSTLPGL